MSDNLKEKLINLGLGDAIKRLVQVQFQARLGYGDTLTQNKEETDMIVQALNQYELDLGFDCNEDGLPDTIKDLEEIEDINIFNVSAKTSCCRITKTGKEAASSNSRSKKTSSRRKASIRKKR